MTANIPEILLLCMDIDFITVFKDALKTAWLDHNPGKLKITPINQRLNSPPRRQNLRSNRCLTSKLLRPPQWNLWPCHLNDLQPTTGLPRSDARSRNSSL
ncbi:hypothetical protein N7491_011224 [Penicillium cf. griseofulvum]|nr:hypothetical protein N7491_011224 [Penicillium cf. griseofulvum]